MPTKEYGFFPETLPLGEKVKVVARMKKSKTCGLVVLPAIQSYFDMQR